MNNISLSRLTMYVRKCRDFPFALGSMDEEKEEIDQRFIMDRVWPTLIARDQPTADFTEKHLQPTITGNVYLSSNSICHTHKKYSSIWLLLLRVYNKEMLHRSVCPVTKHAYAYDIICYERPAIYCNLMVLFKKYFCTYTYIIQICQFITESLFETS